MSKPRPFSHSFGGTVIVLIIAIAMLGVANYRTYRAGFNLPYLTLTATLIDNKQADTAHFFASEADLNTLCRLTGTVRPNWNEQVVIGYFAAAQASSGYEIEPLKVQRQGASVNIHYRLTAPEPSQISPSATTHPVLLIALDRAKLIASSDLSVNFLGQDKTTHSLKIAPGKL